MTHDDAFAMLAMATHVGNVVRYHTVPTDQRQTVGHHSWGVAVVVDAVWDAHTEPIRPELFRWAIQHDMSEQITGDLPAPVKWFGAGKIDAINTLEEWFMNKYPLQAETYLTPLELAVAEFADLYELLLHSAQQYLLGNRLYKTIFLRAHKYLEEIHLGEMDVEIKKLEVFDRMQMMLRYLENRVRGDINFFTAVDPYEIITTEILDRD